MIEHLIGAGLVALGLLGLALILRPQLHRIGEHLRTLAYQMSTAVAVARESATSAEDVRLAQEVKAHNMRLLAAVADVMDGDLEPSGALSEAGAEGYRMGRDATRARLKAALKAGA